MTWIIEHLTYFAFMTLYVILLKRKFTITADDDEENYILIKI